MNVLVLNMGMKSIRSVIFDGNGKKLAFSAKPIRTAINDLRVQQDPQEWWDKGVEVMKASIHDAGITHLDCVTVTTSASCLVCTDGDGSPIGPSIMVSDKRATEEVTDLTHAAAWPAVKERTGLDMSVSLILPKILWIKRNEPELFNRTRWFLTPNDYLIFKLGGSVATDYLNALKYHYDLGAHSYPIDLLDEFGIPVDKLPPVVGTGELVGEMDDSVACALGIDRGAKVVVTSYDAICSFVGSGVAEEGEASDVSGTVTVFRALSRANSTLPSDKVYMTPFDQGEYRIIGGSNNLGGGLIEWAKQCYYAKEEYPYEVMEKEAGESEIGARGIIFLPYLLGERAPIWNDNARGVFFGLERMHTRKDMTRAVFESCAFIDRSISDAIEETGAQVNSVRLSGGLARMGLVSQIKADVLGKEVHVLSDFETTASGAAMMALHGVGFVDSLADLVDRFATVRMTVLPNAANHEKYCRIYELFKEVYRTNLDLFDKRVEVLRDFASMREIQLENL